MRFEKQKAEMIARLRARGIQDPQVLAALQRVPREKFVPVAFSHRAYEEDALPIGFGQTISHPYTVAKMTELLEIRKGMKVLEIGTGSGYQSAVLCELEVLLFTIEINRTLALRAKKILSELKYNLAVRIGDGGKGWPSHAPFDAIVFTAGAAAPPRPVVQQLNTGGRLLIPIGSARTQVLTMFINRGTSVESVMTERFTFVELKKTNRPGGADL
jgi:protein-L-isoaspartate(D-aspartate) O-methyltransferase